jgi:uncharacterized membrane protein YhhN
LAVVLLVVAAVFAVGDWVARLRRRARLEYLCKPATLVALIGLAVALTPVPELATRRWWFVVALVFSLAGDVLLMIPADRFVAGLAAFLIAHLAYVVGFSVHGAGGRALAIALVVVAVVVAPFAVKILRALTRQRPLLAPVTLYMVVISVMVASALATGDVVAGVGAALFVSSDTMIAWNRFVRPFAAADVGIMVTYHLGQGALVLSLLR